jgi:hypothetical protein
VPRRRPVSRERSKASSFDSANSYRGKGSPLSSFSMTLQAVRHANHFLEQWSAARHGFHDLWTLYIVVRCLPIVLLSLRRVPTLRILQAGLWLGAFSASLNLACTGSIADANGGRSGPNGGTTGGGTGGGTGTGGSVGGSVGPVGIDPGRVPLRKAQPNRILQHRARSSWNESTPLRPISWGRWHFRIRHHRRGTKPNFATPGTLRTGCHFAD